MSDKNTKMSGFRVKLHDIDGNESKFALGVSLESSNTANTIVVNSGANTAEATLTRSNDTVSYTANDVLGEATASVLAFTNVSTLNAGSFFVVGANLQYDENAVPSGMSDFRLHLYNAEPSAITDNGAYNLPSDDRDKYLGYVTLVTPIDLGDTLWSENNNVNLKTECADSTNTIYGIIETTGAYTPSASSVVKAILKVVDV